MERLINEVHMLGLKKASLAEREAATLRTVAAIQDACSVSLRPCIQVPFSPSTKISGAMIIGCIDLLGSRLACCYFQIVPTLNTGAASRLLKEPGA